MGIGSELAYWAYENGVEREAFIISLILMVICILIMVYVKKKS